MKEQLKALGIPVVLSSVISLAVVVVPFLFKIDERYAKAEDVSAKISEQTSSISTLSNEVAKLSGIVEVVIAMSSNDSNRRRYNERNDSDIAGLSSRSPASASLSIGSGAGISSLALEEVFDEPVAEAAMPDLAATPVPSRSVATQPKPESALVARQPIVLEDVKVPEIPVNVSSVEQKQQVLDEAVSALKASQRNLAKLATVEQ